MNTSTAQHRIALVFVGSGGAGAGVALTGERGITIGNIQPGPIATDMTADMLETITPLIPVKRVGRPAEIGALVACLTGPDSGHMTGASRTIGGMSL
jgi:3-oxoacyl-[acyl-carrier protein] reductase